MTKITPPANLPADAIGFVAVRQDRPERIAFYYANGILSTSFARDETMTEIREKFSNFRDELGRSYVMDDAGFVRLGLPAGKP